MKAGWWGFDEIEREEWIRNSAARAALEWWNFMLMQVMRDVVEFELFYFLVSVVIFSECNAGAVLFAQIMNLR